MGGTMTDVVKGSVDSWREEEYQSAINSDEFVSQLRGSRYDPFPEDARFLKESMDTEEDASASTDMDEEASASTDMDEEDEPGLPSMSSTVVDRKTLKAVIKAKYFYAGGSARFMFQYKLQELRQQLDRRIGAVPDSDWMSFAEESVSPRTPTAVNTLMQQFQRACTPVSKYVLFRAYEKCRSALVKSVRAAADRTNNLALAGWAFELAQIEIIRASFESTKENPAWATNHTDLWFRPTLEAEFDETCLTLGDVVVENNTVIWCQKWNQGCFDVAFYSEKTLFTIQFTLQEELCMKPHRVRRLRDALSKQEVVVDKCVHIGVRERHWEQLRFKVESVGTGRQQDNEEPEFRIHLYRSPPLTKDGKKESKWESSELTCLHVQDMWKLGTKRRRTSEE